MGIWLELLAGHYFLTRVLPFWVLGIVGFAYIIKNV